MDLDPDLAFGKALISPTGVLSSSSLPSLSLFGCSSRGSVVGVGVGVSPRERGWSVSSRGVGLFFKFMAAGLGAVPGRREVLVG